jgi:hypothetical protein
MARHLATSKGYSPELKDRAVRMVSGSDSPIRRIRVVTRVAPIRRGHRVAAQLDQARRDRGGSVSWDDRGRAPRSGVTAHGGPRVASGQRYLAGGSDFLRGGARSSTQELVTFMDAQRDSETGGRR